MSAVDDYSNDCSNFQLRSVKEANIMLPIGAAMSIFCYMLIFFLYFVMKIPTLQRHPTCKILIEMHLILICHSVGCSQVFL